MPRKPAPVMGVPAIRRVRARVGDRVRVTGGTLSPGASIGPLTVRRFHRRRRRIFMDADDAASRRHTLYVNGEPYESSGLIVRPYLVEVLEDGGS
jgi:hypothetical protein